MLRSHRCRVLPRRHSAGLRAGPLGAPGTVSVPLLRRLFRRWNRLPGSSDRRGRANAAARRQVPPQDGRSARRRTPRPAEGGRRPTRGPSEPRLRALPARPKRRGAWRAPTAPRQGAPAPARRRKARPPTREDAPVPVVLLDRGEGEPVGADQDPVAVLVDLVRRPPPPTNPGATRTPRPMTVRKALLPVPHCRYRTPSQLRRPSNCGLAEVT